MSTSLTSRLALIKPDPGTAEPVDVSDLNANFDKIDSEIGARTCTSGTRPSSPYANQIIRETDTRRLYIWNATQASWDQIAVGTATFTQALNSSSSVLVTRNSGTDHTYRAYISGDSDNRVVIQADGTILFGNGSSTPDVNLYRSGPNQLKTDDGVIIAGTVSTTSSVMRPTEGEDGTDITGISSGTPAAGSPVVGFSFVAPPSGQVFVTIDGGLYCANSSSQVILGWELRTGGTVGSGTATVATNPDKSLVCGRASTSDMAASRRNRVTGLTAGSTYNVRAMHWMGTGTGGQVGFRKMIVEPIF